MLVLGIDTATRFGSVALVSSGDAEVPPIPGGRAPESSLVAEVSRESGMRHGAELLDLVDACLARADLPLERVDAIAVSLGPGSFTGLRVGLATAKGLALGGSLIVGVPTLDALAALSRREGEAGGAGLVCSCLDARKGEVYAAFYAPGDDAPGLVRPMRRLTPDEALSAPALAEVAAGLLADTPGAAGRLAFLGDGAERYEPEVRSRLGGGIEIVPLATVHPRGAAVAALGLGAIRARGGDDLGALAPLYARAPEAERARLARAAAGVEAARR